MLIDVKVGEHETISVHSPRRACSDCGRPMELRRATRVGVSRVSLLWSCPEGHRTQRDYHNQRRDGWQYEREPAGTAYPF